MQPEANLDINKVLEAYNPEIFRKQGYQIVDILADYLNQAISKNIKQSLPYSTPEKMLKKWPDNFSTEPTGNLADLIKRALSQSNHLHHPHYLGHQIAPSLPAAILCDMTSSLLNNSTAVFEMGPVSTVIEKSLINWMAKLVGFGADSDGFLTSGGTLGNITALLAARQIKTGVDVWKKGVKAAPPLAVFVSEQAHYSIKRAGQIMGLGEEGVVLVPVDENYSMDINALEQKFQETINTGKKPFAIIASACTTATGSYDPLDHIADFCEKHNLWLHIDGAHGASALISSKYRDLLKGVERADSISWDAHKMLLMPAPITALIFRDGNNSYEAFSQKASYLFEKGAQSEWYNLALRTMECTKTMMGLKLYTSLSVYGTDFFSTYVTEMHDLTRQFGEMIENSSDFQLAMKPQSNIICFRYIHDEAKDLNLLQRQIRKSILKNKSYYIVQTRLKDDIYLRCTVVNPFTTQEDLKDLLDTIRNTAKMKLNS